MAVMPGASWRPIQRNYQRTRTIKDCVILHSTASATARSMHSWFNQAGANASSHFHVDNYGVIEQYIDTDYVSWANGQANSRSITIETQGDGTTPWTDKQVAAITKIIVWARQAHPQIPLRQMASSARTEKGIGWHRLGVNGNFPATGILRGRGQRGGGESWSSAFGKICPGDARIRQVPGIIKAAAGEPTTPAKPATARPTPARPTPVVAGGLSLPSKGKPYYARVVDGVAGPYTWAALQSFLADRGYYDRVVDGDPGSYTWKGLQRFLADRNFYNRVIDGNPGHYTYTGLQRFLQKNGWYGRVVDGVPGYYTYRALQDYLARRTKK